MRLSEKLRQRRHDDITMLHHSNIGMELIRDAEQLESQNAALMEIVGEWCEVLDAEIICRIEPGSQAHTNLREAIRKASA